MKKFCCFFFLIFIHLNINAQNLSNEFEKKVLNCSIVKYYPYGKSRWKMWHGHFSWHFYYPYWNNYNMGPTGFGYAYGFSAGYFYSGYYNPIVLRQIRINYNKHHEVSFIYGKRNSKANFINKSYY